MKSTQVAQVVIASVLVVLLVANALLIVQTYSRPRASQVVLRSVLPRGMRMQTGTQRQYRFHMFLLTLPNSIERQQVFLKHHNPDVPVELVFGKNTKVRDVALEFAHLIHPQYLAVALDVADGKQTRPNRTYFNLGAIGCYFGHLNMWQTAAQKHIKYAVICEDNVKLFPTFYDQVEQVIDQLGDTFEAVFFYCGLRYSEGTRDTFECVKWFTATKCYLIHVPNFMNYFHTFLPMDNHVDHKFEDAIAAGARVYFRKMKNGLEVDFSVKSTIEHTDWGNKHILSRRHPHIREKQLKQY
jgi:hypothetical protein